MCAAYFIIREGEKRDESGRSKIEQSRTRGENFYPFIFGALGGQSGGNSILFAKSIGEVVKTFTQVPALANTVFVWIESFRRSNQRWELGDHHPVWISEVCTTYMHSLEQVGISGGDAVIALFMVAGLAVRAEAKTTDLLF
jgi:hypothetical protein